MQLWKRGPGIFTVLALVMLACNLALNLVPIVGIVLAQLLLPLLECGLLYACLAADRGDRPRLRHLIGVAPAPPRALLAVIAASLVIFAVETIVAQLLGDVNMITTAGKDTDAMTPGVLIATYAAGIAASLPVMFVPFVALFDGAGVRAAFAQSIAAFARNPGPLLAFGALSFVLLMLGIATSGLGLLLALPWSAAASYAGWKEIFAVD
jgi:uncharacterized membrane protein